MFAVTVLGIQCCQAEVEKQFEHPGKSIIKGECLVAFSLFLFNYDCPQEKISRDMLIEHFN
jgi:hypothetical protein